MSDVRRVVSTICEKSTIVRMMMIILLTMVVSFGSALEQCPTKNSPLGSSINHFGFDLGRQLIPEHGNFFISPFSIYAALAMLYDGTGGSSSSQLSKSLKLSDHKLLNENLKNSFRNMLVNLQQNEFYNLTVADGIFIQDGYPVKPTFVNNMKQYYQGLVKTLDFANNGDAAKDEINSWVAEITRGMIKDLLTQPKDPMTKLILVNAIYFMGAWESKFYEFDTYDGTFYKPNNEEKKVKLMKHQEDEFNFYNDISTGYEFLEMPYAGGDISMLLALPKDRNQYPALDMTSDKFCTILDNLKMTMLESVVIPKFKFEYENELREGLEKLGVKDIFDDGAANLSGISDDQNLVISSIFHKTVIDVNEDGTEAAAATEVDAISMAAYISDEPPIYFVADHPFLFYIIEKRNGIIIFSGRLDEP